MNPREKSRGWGINRIAIPTVSFWQVAFLRRANVFNVVYSDSIDAPNDRFRDESFTIVRHRLLTKCWTQVRMLASGASINRRTFLETRQLKLPCIIPLREEDIISWARSKIWYWWRGWKFLARCPFNNIALIMFYVRLLNCIKQIIYKCIIQSVS